LSDSKSQHKVLYWHFPSCYQQTAITASSHGPAALFNEALELGMAMNLACCGLISTMLGESVLEDQILRVCSRSNKS
jgi:hypothetical protein